MFGREQQIRAQLYRVKEIGVTDALCENIGALALAKEAGFHAMYFSSIFKRATGESYVQRLNHLRLEYAATLLANNYSVSYACFESGFGSLSNFFTAFKKKYGMGPREYAKEKTH